MGNNWYTCMCSFGMIHICIYGVLLYCFLVLFVFTCPLHTLHFHAFFVNTEQSDCKNNAFKLLQLYCFTVNKHTFKICFILSFKIGLFCLLYSITHKGIIKWCSTPPPSPIYFPSHWKIQSEFLLAVLSLKRIYTKLEAFELWETRN